jgi:RNA polymerase nonessential primary-like sigma factor
MNGYKAPKLTNEEKLRLYHRMKQGDMDAKNTLALSVIPWALRLATRRRVFGLDLSDLAEAANVAVAYALERWEPDRGALTTTVAWAVRSEIDSMRRCMAGVIKIPKPEIYQHDNKYVAQVLNAASIDHDTAAKLTIGMDTSAKKARDADARWFADAKQKAIWIATHFFDEKMRIVWERRCQGHTLQEIATDLQLSKERIRQIQVKVTQTLKRWAPHVPDSALESVAQAPTVC